MGFDFLCPEAGVAEAVFSVAMLGVLYPESAAAEMPAADARNFLRFCFCILIVP